MAVRMSGEVKYDQVVGPLANDLGVPGGARSAPDDAEPAVSDLVAVAVGTVQHIASPPVSEAGDVRQLVPQPGGDQYLACGDALPICEQRPEALSAVRGQLDDFAENDLAAVARDLSSSGGE